MEITWLTCQKLQLEVENIIPLKSMMENTVLPLEITWGVWRERARKLLESSESIKHEWWQQANYIRM
jgi:hypothetical protein